MKFAYHIKDRMRRTRYFIYMLMSVWKMLCFLCFMLVVMFFKGENVTQIFSSANAGFSQHKIQVLEVIDDQINVFFCFNTTKIYVSNDIIFFVFTHRHSG